MSDKGIGASSKRREDVRFLSGNGKYTDDINVRGQKYVYFLRSDVAHGKINDIDTNEAASMPGVVGIFTGADFAEVGGLPCGWQVTDRFGEAMKRTGSPGFGPGQSSACGRSDCRCCS